LSSHFIINHCLYLVNGCNKTFSIHAIRSHASPGLFTQRPGEWKMLHQIVNIHVLCAVRSITLFSTKLLISSRLKHRSCSWQSMWNEASKRYTLCWAEDCDRERQIAVKDGVLSDNRRRRRRRRDTHVRDHGPLVDTRRPCRDTRVNER